MHACELGVVAELHTQLATVVVAERDQVAGLRAAILEIGPVRRGISRPSSMNRVWTPTICPGSGRGAPVAAHHGAR